MQVHGDTLEITGFAPSDCTELRIVAFRSGNRLHVQVEPSDIPPDPCVSPSVRQFEARFTLPPEPTYLLVTNGFFLPGELFKRAEYDHLKQVEPTAREEPRGL